MVTCCVCSEWESVVKRLEKQVAAAKAQVEYVTPHSHCMPSYPSRNGTPRAEPHPVTTHDASLAYMSAGVSWRCRLQQSELAQRTAQVEALDKDNT